MRKLLLCLIAVSALSVPSQASATTIDFENLVGPSLFGNPASSPQYVFGPLTVTFAGGTILTATANMPANQTSIYGTVGGFCCNGLYSSSLTVTFSSPITNFFLDVLNGNLSTVTYRVSDNAGHSQDFPLAPNTQSGAAQIGFAATGTVVTIQALTGLPSWDFFVDNVHFNEELPTQLRTVPEPGTMVLFATGLVAFAARRLRRR